MREAFRWGEDVATAIERKWLSSDQVDRLRRFATARAMMLWEVFELAGGDGDFETWNVFQLEDLHYKLTLLVERRECVLNFEIQPDKKPKRRQGGEGGGRKDYSGRARAAAPERARRHRKTTQNKVLSLPYNLQIRLRNSEFLTLFASRLTAMIVGLPLAVWARIEAVAGRANNAILAFLSEREDRAVAMGPELVRKTFGDRLGMPLVLSTIFPIEASADWDDWLFGRLPEESERLSI